MKQLNMALRHAGPARDQPMDAAKHQRNFVALLLIWFMVNLLQAVITDIGNDEAYYTLYAQRLDWGYFDHPPFIAFLISVGKLFFAGELGTRFFIVIAQVVSLFVLWKIIDEREVTFKKMLLFFGIAASMPLLQIYGFIATPDAGLLFFTAIFFWAYQRFLEKETFSRIFFLSISMAGLMYSKYHGALVILLTLLSNLRLLGNFRFWLSGSIALLLFTPHLIWQFENRFPTFQYQMAGRAKTFQWKHFLEYWPNQLLVLNPLVIFALIISFREKMKDDFTRALWAVLIGFILFFGIASFWVRPEPHWTAAISIPAVILLYRYFASRPLYWKKAFIGILISLTLIISLRILLMVDLLPVHIEFHGQKKWANQIDQLAGDLPVAFINSYQKASVYSFYTGKPSFSLNNIDYRQNQFDLWQDELNYVGKQMAFFSEPMIFETPFDSSSIVLGKLRMVVDTLVSYQRIKMDITNNLPDTIKTKTPLSIQVNVSNPHTYPVALFNSGKKVLINAVFIQNKKKYISPAFPKSQPDILLPGGSRDIVLRFEVPEIPPGTYQFGFGIQTDLLPPAFNSKFVRVSIR